MGAGNLVVGPFRATFAFGADDRVDEYRLRYDVFVEEYRFEPEDRCPDRMERDEYDDASCSLLLRDDSTGEAVACQRLILPDFLPHGMLTNLERRYEPFQDRERVDLAAMSRNSWAEVSRTTIAPRYRWGAAGRSVPTLLAINYATIALAVAFERATLFSLSEPVTSKLIRRLGFEMKQIGAAVDFHGIRAPFRMVVDEMARSVPDRNPLDDLIGAARLLAARVHSSARVA